MNQVEKIGLVAFIFGLLAMTAMFVIGGGDAATATRNGEPISFVFPVASFVVGVLLFVFGHKAG